MKRLIILILMGLAAWQAYGQYQGRARQHAGASDSLAAVDAEEQEARPAAFKPGQLSSERFSCDGRQHCSQMHSCEEATFFLKNCPDTKMDGDHDGVPCERQWCQ